MVKWTASSSRNGRALAARLNFYVSQRTARILRGGEKNYLFI